MTGRSLSWLWLAFSVACSSAAESSDAGAEQAPDAGAVTDAAQRHLATSASHTCAIRSAGLYCWGSNGRGELGDGTTDDSESPVRAQAAGDDVVEVAAHSGRTCVRRKSGEVACWGANQLGQIGDGTREDSLNAVRAQGIDDARQLAVDDNSTCVVHGSARNVSCWGESPKSEPELGSTLPKRIAGVAGVKELRVGAFGSYCALADAGEVWCWRVLREGWTAPVRAALSRVRAITMPHADYVCAIPERGDIVCQSIASGMEHIRVELPGSDDAVGLEAGSGGLAVCAVNAAGTWQGWNVPSYVFESMGVADVAGLFPFKIESDMPLRELVIAGFRLCILRDDASIACLDSAAMENAAMLLVEMRIILSTPVTGFPE